MFDKELYWKRRKHVTITKNEEGEVTSATPAPLRGQGEPLPTKLIKPSNTKRVFAGTSVPVPMNRKLRRRKIVDRRFNKKGYNFGRKIGSKEDNMIHHWAKIRAEK